MLRRTFFFSLLSSLSFLMLPGISALSHAADPTLTLKKGDVWVMAGDSITAQRQHSNYIEAFCRTRYPQLGLQFRNSGIGGNRTSHILERFEYDVAGWKPTIVSIELGMNDVGAGDDPTAYINGMRELIKKIRGINATPVLISSSPVNDGSLPGAWKGDRCRRIDPYTVALKKLAEEENVVMIDQYHSLLEMWGKNLQAEKPIALGGDPVHPGPVGQTTMAATIVKGLNLSSEVSSASLKFDGTAVETKGCAISEISANPGRLAFTRLDEASPWPIDAKAKDALTLMPEIAGLSQWTLKIPELPEGKYHVLINGKPAAIVSGKDLAAGWNISTASEGAVAERAAHVVGLIAKLQSGLNNNWRAASKAKDAGKLDAAQKAIDEVEAELQAACQPVALKFVIEKE